MTEKLTWTEIKQRYPDEWVLLEECQDDGVELTQGAVVAHDSSRMRLIELSRTAKSPFSVSWTGKITRTWMGVYVEAVDRED